MAGLLAGMARSGLRQRAADAARSARRGVMIAVAGLTAVTFAVASACCVVAALWIFVAERVGAWQAALAAALLLAVLAAACCAIAARIGRKRARPPSPPPEAGLGDLARLLGDGPDAALVIAVLAGLMVGRNATRGARRDDG